MKLTFKNRLVLLSILPVEGNRVDLLIAKSIAQKCEITVEEITEFEIKTEGNATVWNKKANEREFEIAFTLAELDLIEKRLKKLDEESKLTLDTNDLYDLFVK